MSILTRVSAVLTAAAFTLPVVPNCCAQQADQPGIAITVPAANGNDGLDRVQASGEWSATWESDDTRIVELHSGGNDGRAGVRQGSMELRARKLVLIESRRDNRFDIRIFACDNVRFTSHGQTRHMATHQMVLQSFEQVSVASNIFTSAEKPTHLMAEAVRKIGKPAEKSVLATGFQTERSPFVLPPEVSSSQSLSRRIQVRPRSSQPLQFDSFISRDTVPEERVYKFTGGVNVLVEGAADRCRWPNRLTRSAGSGRLTASSSGLIPTEAED